MICSKSPQVVVDPSDYSTLLDALKSGKDDLDFRKRLAWKAYQHTATYDSTVAEWMWSQIGALLTYTTDTTVIIFMPYLCRRIFESKLGLPRAMQRWQAHVHRSTLHEHVLP